MCVLLVIRFAHGAQARQRRTQLNIWRAFDPILESKATCGFCLRPPEEARDFTVIARRAIRTESGLSADCAFAVRTVNLDFVPFHCPRDPRDPGDAQLNIWRALIPILKSKPLSDLRILPKAS